MSRPCQQGWHDEGPMGGCVRRRHCLWYPQRPVRWHSAELAQDVPAVEPTTGRGIRKGREKSQMKGGEEREGRGERRGGEGGEEREGRGKEGENVN